MLLLVFLDCVPQLDSVAGPWIKALISIPIMPLLLFCIIMMLLRSFHFAS